MLRLTPFTYLQPSSLEEAAEMVNEHQGEYALMGGGTDLLPNIKHRLASPKFVIGLSNVTEMQTLSFAEGEGMRIGGAVPLSSIENSKPILEKYPALSEAASFVSSPQVRRLGTIGGNICLDVRCNYYNQSEHWRKSVGYCMKKDSEICRVAPGGDRCWAVSSADTVPVLIAYGAEVRIVGSWGTRWQSLTSVYQDDGLTPMRLLPGDIVAEVRVPKIDGLHVRYSKLRIRLSFDFPLVGAATGIRFAPDETVAEAHIVLTAVGSYPIEVTEAERLLQGTRLTEEAIRAAGDKVFRVAHPMDNTEGSIPHRKRMARIYVERSLRELSIAGGTERASIAC